MKISTKARPSEEVQQRASPAVRQPGEGNAPNSLDGQPPPEGDFSEGSRPEFRAIYDAWFNEVLRWTRALGGPEADRDDIVQEVFLVVRRRLGSFDGGNLAGWLYRITRRQVRDFRRRTWVKHIFAKGHIVDPERLPNRQSNPADVLEHKEDQRVLHGMLQKMNEDRRVTFVLFEIEGLSGEEIALIQNVPVNTVWTRLHHARREFFALAARYQRAQRSKGE